MIFDTVKRWEMFREPLLEALTHAHGTHTEDDVLRLILVGEYKLWTFERSAVVTFFVQYPQFKAMNLFLCGGDLGELVSKQPMMELWAQTQGVKRCVAGGRPGWERIFPDYSKNGCMYYKDI